MNLNLTAVRIPTLTINLSTVEEVSKLLGTQPRLKSATKQAELFQNIYNSGYNTESIIYVDAENTCIAEGNTRLSVSCQLVRQGLVDTIEVPYLLLNKEEAARMALTGNGGTRGLNKETMLNQVQFINHKNLVMKPTNNAKALQECYRAVEMAKGITGEHEIYAFIDSNFAKLRNMVIKSLLLVADKSSNAIEAHSYSFIIAAMLKGATVSSVPDAMLTTSKSLKPVRITNMNTLVSLGL